MKDEELPGRITWEPLQEDEIRILVLLPSKDYNAPLQGRTERRKLVSQETLDIEQDDGGYEAISYCWGTPDDLRESSISIDGTGLPIWPDLGFALKRIRKKEEERQIWVDAICINQSDTNERNRQIRKMGQIFRSAERVLSWLGEASEVSAGALKFLNKVAKATETHDVLTSDAFPTEWQSVRVLLMHPWFARVWILQEISVARHAAVLLGTESLEWTLFLTAMDKFCTFRTFHTPRALSLHSNSDALIYADAEAWRSNEEFSDHSRPWKEVQKASHVAGMEHSQSLDVIFRPWTSLGPSPSSWHQADDRDRTVSLIQAPEQKSPYNLFGGLNLDPEFRGFTVLDNGIRVNMCYIFDEVDIITGVHDTWDTPFPKSWLSIDFMNSLPRFIYALLAGNVDVKHCIKLGRYIKKVADEEEEEEDYSRRLSLLSEFAEAFEKLRALTKGRRLFESKRRAVKGLGPASMKTGDCNPAPVWHHIILH